MASSKKARSSVLADGTTVDQDYYQSKQYILAQLETRKGSEKKSATDKSSKKENMDAMTKAMLKSGAVSEDDGWLLASMELTIRNPFCIANHPAQEQMKFYQKVFFISTVFMFMVAFATLMWTWWWGIIIKQGIKPIMPCRGNGGTTFGVVRLCNDTSSQWNTELTEDGCDEGAPLSVCVEDACVQNIDDDLRNCWFLAAFVMVVFAAYMLLLFRRDQAGKGLLSCACFIEGILGGAGTLHYDSSIFLEFFTYLTASSFLALVIFTKVICQKNMPEWEKLTNQVGSTKITTPEVETIMMGAVKKSYCIGAAITSFVALVWHFGTPVRLTGGSTIAFFLAIFTLWLSVCWIIREISWTQHKYDADQFVNMCISFHVDLYCIFILFMIFCFFVINDSCHQGPIGCAPNCMYMCGLQAERCARFACGVPGRNMSTGASEDGTVPAGEGTSKKADPSAKVEKEVETQDEWKRRKMINAGCACGILALAGISFFAPQLSFAVALAICVGLPFFRAMKNREEDHANV